MKVLVVASECVPFAKTGGLGDVVGALPKALARRGHEVWVVLPRYASVAPGKVVERRLEIPMGGGHHAVDIHEGQTLNGVRHFFVEYPPYFDREGLYQVQGRDHPDNAERFALFSKAVVKFLQRAEPPDVVHCHDWQSALVPVLLKTPPLANSRIGPVPVILTVHNLGYQGAFPADAKQRIGLPGELFAAGGLESYGRVNFLKAGLLYADYITTVSRRYAEEIQEPECGHGLDPVVRQRAASLTGILNGVDYTEWNPETDPHIAANYSSAKLEGKQLCRADLLQQFHLSEGESRQPVVGIVSRFASQKGFDLMAEAANVLMRENLFLVALGTGEPRYEQLFRQLAARHPNKCAVRIAFDNALAHKIEAGSDIFLMPSKYEPCGLNQIYSLKYGTVPVVRAVGGLDDTVVPYDAGSETGTGFKFTPYSGEAMLDALREALGLYRQNSTAWLKLIRNGMQQDFSWDTSAAQYERLYDQVSRGNAGSPAS